MATQRHTLAESNETTEPRVPPALRTTAYLVISMIGAGIAVAAFLPWAGVTKAGASRYDFAIEVVGVDAGGWGEAAFVAGAVIFLVGVLGYYWNPFSDPEAGIIAGFSALTLFAALIKLVDLNEFVDPTGEFSDADATVAPGFWLIIVGAALTFCLAVWILLSRPGVDELDQR